MVGGKLQPKCSKVFHECYLKYCEVQNLIPLRCVVKYTVKKHLDFHVDHIKDQDWPPILKALGCDLSLRSVSIRCRSAGHRVLGHMDCERLAHRAERQHSAILTNHTLSSLVEALATLISKSTSLITLRLVGLPCHMYFDRLCTAIESNKSLENLDFSGCPIGDPGCMLVCRALKNLTNVKSLDLSRCQITKIGAGYIANLVQFQKINRYSEAWRSILRYRPPELDSMTGLRAIAIRGNPFGVEELVILLETLADDLWIKELKLDIKILE